MGNVVTFPLPLDKDPPQIQGSGSAAWLGRALPLLRVGVQITALLSKRLRVRRRGTRSRTRSHSCMVNARRNGEKWTYTGVYVDSIYHLTHLAVVPSAMV